ncbi:VWA domain-containing protein [Corynebacterium sp. p3-SID1194]|uniref:vWA domain-containing protein n=1 Tax=Corynebacterium sp. p3-SID1194 TaxID=2916105 RepID=UPI0021A5F70E|nr:VWA domain-containing protein [Corynebacterium sp. p3-SID1194]MCT1451112.1 VWA domain-containing protein [Corynebacterium sp. p3-SID1194]
MSFVSVLFVAALVAVWTLVAPGDAVAQRDSESSSAESSSAAESSTESSSTELSESAGSSGSDEATVDSKAALVLDASWSMAERDVDGGTRMDAAKQASHDLVNSLPEQANLGLLAYGMRESNAPDNRDAGCRDIETLVPVGKLDKGELNSKIDEMSPKGYTPVGNSLKAAAEELGDSGERTIILVSDGIDTCAPPPVCEVAKELAGDGFDLTIHTVGFKTDEDARKELECVAEAGGGEFIQADDAGSLAESLKFLAQRDAETYQTAGTEFEYSDTPEDAKWLGEGKYHTKVTAKVPSDSDEKAAPRYFNLAVPEGHRAIVSTTIIPNRSASGRAHSGTFNLRHHGIENGNEDCQASNAGLGGFGETKGNGYSPPQPVVTELNPQKALNGCDPQHWILPTEIYLGNTNDKSSTEETGIEVEVNFEPIPEGGTGGAPAGSDDSKGAEKSLDFAGAQDIKGGSSFSDAVEVKPGAYKDAIVPGEYRFYKIPVEYGQRPVVSFRSDASVRDEADYLEAMLYTPLRERKAEDQILLLEDDRQGSLAGPVVKPGKENAGYYFVGVVLTQGSEDDVMGVEQPFEIAFDAVGEKADGPKWRPTEENGPEPSDTPPDTGGKKDDGEEKSDDTDTQAQDESDDGGLGAKGILMLGLGIGIVVLLAALAGIIAVLRRR